ncbi:hypothetical protein ATJ93_4490 [Halopiger aswanensis]|uniref:Uncharacterized protein n=1 Tax=Halopiger aswanensis TaxID=148449 RepID=A0A3R7DWI9_9EURY|nr:hypothetical protein ATJ93_4490 [Halopiger aswanensis]
MLWAISVAATISSYDEPENLQQWLEEFNEAYAEVSEIIPVPHFRTLRPVPHA